MGDEGPRELAEHHDRQYYPWRIMGQGLQETNDNETGNWEAQKPLGGCSLTISTESGDLFHVLENKADVSLYQGW